MTKTVGCVELAAPQRGMIEEIAGERWHTSGSSRADFGVPALAVESWTE